MATTVAQGYRSNKIHPHRFALWITCASIIMLFAALTSAYLVRQSAGNWLEFRLPNIFFYNTLVIVASSLTLHGAYLAYQRGRAAAYRGLLGVSLVLGILFLVLQYQGWLGLVDIGIPLKTNPSGDFIYAISGLHAAHVLGGLAAIAISFGAACLLPFRVTDQRKLRLELVASYWHFVDFLWVYLIVFWALQG